MSDSYKYLRTRVHMYTRSFIIVGNVICKYPTAANSSFHTDGLVVSLYCI